MDQIMGIIQTSFLLNLKTGNTIIDAMLTVFLVYFAKRLIDIMPKLKEYIGLILAMKSKVKAEYLIQGTITISTEYCSHYINFPDEYKSIMYQISKNNIDIEFGRQFNQFDRHGNQLNSTTNNLFSFSEISESFVLPLKKKNRGGMS